LNVAAAGVLTNDTDADGDALTAVVVVSPSHAASFTLNANGGVSYAPTTNYYGYDAFTYKAYDSKGYSSIVTASINVYQEIASNNSVPAGGSVTTDNEVPADGATITNPLEATVTLPATLSGAVSISTGTLQPSDIPPSGYTFFNYETDIAAPNAPSGSWLTFVFLLDPSIIPAGQNKDTVQVFRNGVVVANCTGAGLSPDPCVGLRELAGDDIKLTVRTSAAGRWSFGKRTANSAPVAVNDSYTATLNTLLTVNAPGVLGNDTDADSNTLTAAVVTGPAHAASFTLNPNGSFNYTPATGYSGPDSFTYVANDGTVNSAPATVNITVNSTPPTITIDTQTINNPARGTTATMTFHVTLSVASSQTITVQFATQNQTAFAGTDYTATSGTLTFAPGTTMQTIPVTILNANGSTSKQFAVNLSNPVNATIAIVNGSPSRGFGAIIH